MDGLLLWALSIIGSAAAGWYVSKQHSRRSTLDISQKIDQLEKALIAELPQRVAEAVRPHLAVGQEDAAMAAIRRRIANHVREATQAITGVGIASGEAVGTPTIMQDSLKTDVRAGHWHGPQGSFGEARVAQPGDAEKKPEKPSGPYGASGG